MGNVNAEQNVEHSKGLFEFLEKTLGVPGKRGYMYVSGSEFSDWVVKLVLFLI